MVRPPGRFPGPALDLRLHLGGSVIKHDIVAACGLRLEFGNRVVTSRIRAVRVIRGTNTDDPRLRPAGSRELLVACYGQDYNSSILG